jgi:glycosyltransferase involved in cell wall biosynthesis
MISSAQHDFQQLSILHLVGSVSKRSGGLGPVAVGLAEGQLALGHRPTIWTLDQDADSELENEFKPQVSLQVYPTYGPFWLGFSPVMEKAINQQGHTWRVLHQHSIWKASSRVTNRWRDTFRRPTVIAPQGTLEHFAVRRSSWKKQLAALAYEKKNLKKASCLQATSNSEALSFRTYGLANPIAIIPNGVSDTWIESKGDAQRFRLRFSIEPHQRLLLFLSRLHPKKGLPLLFEAISHIRARMIDWKLIIVGPDELDHRRYLEQLAQRLGVAALVQFIGPLSGQAKRDAFEAADVFILPTYSDNFAIAVAEALASSVPVITTRGAPWEDLVSYKCGWWTEIDVQDLTEALLDAIHRPQTELKEMGRRGQALVIEKYTWRQAAEKSIQLYQWLLGQRDCPDFVVID